MRQQKIIYRFTWYIISYLANPYGVRRLPMLSGALTERCFRVQRAEGLQHEHNGNGAYDNKRQGFLAAHRTISVR